MELAHAHFALAEPAEPVAPKRVCRTTEKFPAMAVDVLVMPLARYVTGNYVTPAMEQAWAEFGVYRVGRPGAVEDIPPGVPLGGVQAPARCDAIAAELQRQLNALPEVAGAMWDETAEATYFQRVEHEPLLALRWQAAALAEEPPSLLRRMARRLMGRRAAAPAIALAAANVFVPGVFDEPFELEAPQDLGVYDCGSLARLVDELASLAVSVEAGTPEAQVLGTLVTAAEIASQRRLPLILDL